MDTIDARLAALAARQHAVFAMRQAAPLGITQRMVQRRAEAGRLELLHRGVYRIAGAPETWRQMTMAAVLAYGPDAFAARRTAGHLWRSPLADHHVIEVIVGPDRRRAVAGVEARRVPLPPPRDIRIIDAIPVTAIGRTLFDLAVVCPIEVVEEAVDDALRRHLVTVRRLLQRLHDPASIGGRGTAVMRAVLAQRDPDSVPPKSVFETRLLREMRNGGLPKPVRQYAIRDRGRLVGIVDAAYPDLRVAVEADGYQWHASRARWENDLRRGTDLLALDWMVVRVSWHQLLTDPQRVVERIRQVMAIAQRRGS